MPQPRVWVDLISVVVPLQDVVTCISHPNDPILHICSIEVENKKKHHPHKPQHKSQKDIGRLQGEVSHLCLVWNNTSNSLDTEPLQQGAIQPPSWGTPYSLHVHLSSWLIQPGHKVLDLTGAGVGVVSEKDLDVPERLQLLESISAECAKGIVWKVQHLQLVHAREGSTVDRHQRVVSKEELLQAGEVGEHARGQQGELVPREVEAEEPSEAAPAQSCGEVGQGGEVVERAAQAELLKGTAGYAESFWMDEHQLVPTEVQEAQVEEGREAVGGHLCDPVKMTHTVNVCSWTFNIILSCK